MQSEARAVPRRQSSEDRIADVDRLGDQIAELSAHIQAATYRLLVMIREFDERSGWNTGFRSCAHWLNWRTGLDLGAAREKVRVARASSDLPLISEAMRRGRLSYSKVRALTRVATVENEEELLDFALTGTAAHVETLVRAWRRVARIEDAESEEGRRRHRSVNYYTDEDGMLAVEARLDPEAGAVLVKALEAASETLYEGSREGSGPSYDELPIEERRAEALELVAERALEVGLESGACTGTRGDRYQVVVHVQGGTVTASEGAPSEAAPSEAAPSEVAPSEVVVSPPARISERRAAEDSDGRGRDRPPGGVGLLENGIPVSAETSARLACGGSRVVMMHGQDGSVLDVGRKTRAIPPALRRALTTRDGGCRFPGCGLHLCDAHHVEPWAEGGETRLDNLVLLCRFHHRAMHEGGWRMELSRGGGVRFFSPDGRLVPEAPLQPGLEGDPAVTLTRRNRALGLMIDATTADPTWSGEPFDVRYAIQALRGRGCRDVSAETSNPRHGPEVPGPDPAGWH